jgi:hypothetical protein
MKSIASLLTLAACLAVTSARAPNPHRPRSFGGKGAEGMKKGFPSSKRDFLAVLAVKGIS